MWFGLRVWVVELHGAGTVCHRWGRALFTLTQWMLDLIRHDSPTLWIPAYAGMTGRGWSGVCLHCCFVKSCVYALFRLVYGPINLCS